MHTTAILLAGGKGSRMDYRDKAWVKHQGLPLIMHVINTIEPQVENIIISRNASHASYESLPYCCVADDNNDHDGPLAGIMACMPHVKTPQVLVVPCDTPNLPTDLVTRLSSGLSQHSIAIAHDNTRMQPLVFLAKSQALGTISDYLASGKRSVMGWIEQTPNTEIQFDGVFENINQPEQLK